MTHGLDGAEHGRLRHGGFVPCAGLKSALRDTIQIHSHSRVLRCLLDNDRFKGERFPLPHHCYTGLQLEGDVLVVNRDHFAQRVLVYLLLPAVVETDHPAEACNR